MAGHWTLNPVCAGSSPAPGIGGGIEMNNLSIKDIYVIVSPIVMLLGIILGWLLGAWMEKRRRR